MSKKDLIRLNLERTTEPRDGKVDAFSNSLPSSPKSWSKSGVLKSPKDKSKSAAKARRTASVQLKFDSANKSSPRKSGADGDVYSNPQDSSDNKTLRNFGGGDDSPGPSGKHKKRAASTTGSERDLATATSSTSVASPGKVVGANGSSVSMYPGDAPSRRATVHIHALSSPLTTLPFLGPNGSVEGNILIKTKKSGWKKIWIRTEGSLLLMHKERSELKPTKQFDLKNASIRYGEPQDNTLSIQITLGDGKILLFSAINDSNVTVWCNLLNEVIQRNSAAKHRPRTSQIPMELIELLTEASNSHCAECNTEPADIASVAFGAFVCKDCATLHRALDPSISTFVVPTSSIDWSPAAIKFMRDVGNKAHNEFWEKEIPSGISKPTPASTLEEKKQWVLSKYVTRSMTGGATAEEASKRIRSVHLPEQYVDDNDLLTPRQKEYAAHHRAKSSEFNIPVLLDSVRQKKLPRQKEFSASPASSPRSSIGPLNINSPRPGPSSGLATGGSTTGTFDSFLRNTDLLKEALLHMLQDTEFRRDLRSILLDDSKKE